MDSRLYTRYVLFASYNITWQAMLTGQYRVLLINGIKTLKQNYIHENMIYIIDQYSNMYKLHKSI